MVHYISKYKLGLKYQPPTLLDIGCGDAASTYGDMRRKGNDGTAKNSMKGWYVIVHRDMTQKGNAGW